MKVIKNAKNAIYLFQIVKNVRLQHNALHVKVIIILKVIYLDVLLIALRRLVFIKNYNFKIFFFFFIINIRYLERCKQLYVQKV